MEVLDGVAMCHSATAPRPDNGILASKVEPALAYGMSATLPSIKFIKNCSRLKELRFVDVDVADGDMTPLLTLEDFAFTKKRHFSHTEKELTEPSKTASHYRTSELFDVDAKKVRAYPKTSFINSMVHVR